MGVCSSATKSKETSSDAKTRRDSESGVVESALAKQVMEQIKKIGASRKSSIKTFDAIAMKFKQIENGFDAIRKIFENMDADKSGYVSYEEFSNVVRKGLNLDEGLVAQLFEYGEVDKSARELDFKSFILAFASLYLLIMLDKEDCSMSTLTADGESISKCFTCVVDAFLFLDTDNDGHISEVRIVGSSCIAHHSYLHSRDIHTHAYIYIYMLDSNKGGGGKVGAIVSSETYTDSINATRTCMDVMTIVCAG